MFNVIEIKMEVPQEAWYRSPVGVKERGMLKELYWRTWEILFVPCNSIYGKAYQPKRRRLDGK